MATRHFSSAAVLLLGSLVHSTHGASETQRHYHNGKLARYEIGPPSLVLTVAEENTLRGGKPVMACLPGDDGGARLIMVQDIKAPASVVLGRVVDFDNYDRMVAGCNSCITYDSETVGDVQKSKATYEIQALHMKLTYFCEHHFDPAARCVTFHLDYDRRSDLDDSVGYWYAEPTGRNSCRVYYSCECKLLSWVPGPVYNMLTKEALKKATVWVEREAVREFRSSRRKVFSTDELVQFVSSVRNTVASARLPQLPNVMDSWVVDRGSAALRLATGPDTRQIATARLGKFKSNVVAALGSLKLPEAPRLTSTWIERNRAMVLDSVCAPDGLARIALS